MILVTGATGLVGGHLIWHLLQENEKIAATKRVTSKLEALRKIFSFYTDDPDKFIARIEWRIADISDKKSLADAIKGVEDVYHCAAVVSLGNNPGKMSEVNIEGTRNIVEVALTAKIRKFCFVSSIAACGWKDDESLIDENTVWEDNEARSPYSRSKYFSEFEVWKVIKAGLNAVIVNPGVILGYSGTESGSSQLFSVVRKGLPFYIDGGSGYVAVQDVVKAMILLMKSDVSSERFILVEDNYTNKQILGSMAKGFGRKLPLIKIGGGLIRFAGAVLEFAGKLFRVTPLLDRKMASTATKRSFYSAEKFKTAFNYEFYPIENCIEDVCKAIIKERNQGN